MLSSRIESIPFSSIRQMFEKSNELERRGKEIIHLEIGRPDFDTPEHIKAAACKALKEGFVHYTSNYGTPELRKALTDKIFKQTGVQYDSGSEIVVTVGAAEALYLSLMVLIEPDDEIMVFTPCFSNYLNVPKLMDAKVIEVPLSPELNYQPREEDLVSSCTPKTKIMIVNSPSNPTGAVLSEESMQLLVDFARENSIVIISDEVYEAFIYGGKSYKSMLSVPGAKGNTILVNSFSKTYSMTGWRIGYVAADSSLIRAMVKAHQNMIACATSFAQAGALAALTESQDCVAEMAKEYEIRKNLVVDGFNAIPGVKCPEPGGAFYAFPCISHYDKDSAKIAEYLLQEAGVVTVPGKAFGSSGEGYIRISFSNSRDNIKKALANIEKALQKYK